MPHSDQSKPHVYLFFDGYDLRARDGLKGKIESLAHFYARRFKRKLCKQQVHTGFYVAFEGMVNSLRAIGCSVHINDFAGAKKNPDYPIGVGGYPSILEHVAHLPNPRIFGPGDWGTPDNSKAVVEDDRYKLLIQPSDWFRDIYRPTCGDKMVTWFAGINTDDIPVLSDAPKTYDFLIYDKIRWSRDKEVPRVLEPIIAELERKGLTYTRVRYGHHRYDEFIEGLRNSRSMLFVCEHETQGLACQEALAANIPVLTWDEGVLVDPTIRKYQTEEIEVSSVPYFDERCGDRFKIKDFVKALEAFQERHKDYQPRAFVEDTLSLEIAGRNYLELYRRLMA